LVKNAHFRLKVESVPSLDLSFYAEESLEYELKPSLHISEIPLAIFKTPLGPLQLLVKYLKEQQMPFSEIASLLHRSYRTIWLSYQQGKMTSLEYSSVQEALPLSIFSKELSTLESIVVYLKQFYSYAQISRLLNKDQRTIWTIYQRAIKK